MKLIGQVLDGRYRIDDVLGQGGMGMVFRATQTSVQREVAVKTLHPTLAAAPQFFERFKREAEMASRLRHPGIITIFDFGRTADGTCYYVMELLEGRSLKQLVKKDGPLPLGRAVDIIEQAARALAHAHQMGVIHRDLKPHNMMVQALDGRDFVKVLDFGLVKALEQDENEQLTSTGQVLGTPQYMPPEQAGGESVDQRSDLYSLAGVLFFCLTGASPFGANTVRKALQASLTQSVPPVGKRRRGAPVPPEVDEFFRKGLAREKEDRYQSADEFTAELRMAICGLSQSELDAVPLPPEPGTAREGSGSGSPERDKGTVAARKNQGSSSASRARAASNVVVDPALREQPPSSAAQSPPRSARGRNALRVAVPVIAVAALAVGYLALGGGHRSTTLGGPVQVVQLDTRPADPPLPPTPAPPTDITVHFASDPPGAGVYDGEVQIGTTPVALRLERDRVLNLTFQLAGHSPVERVLDFSRHSEDRTTVTVSLSKAAESRPTPASGQGTSRKGTRAIPVFE
jgi:serine/threonine protein kinase